MSEQQSQKRGVCSEEQKMDRARYGYEEIPAAAGVAGAFGHSEPDRASDLDVSLKWNVPSRQTSDHKGGAD